LTRILDHRSPNRVEYDVTAKRQEVTVPLDKDGLESTLKNVPNSLVPTIETLGVYPVQMSHTSGEICIDGLHHKVVVILHEAIGVAEPVETVHGLVQKHEKSISVPVILVDIHLGVSS
jgi:hypothetical protein